MRVVDQIRPEVVVLLGDRIRALRKAAGLSVVRLAELSGVSRRMLTQIELGQANPSLSTVDRVASALGTTFSALAGVLGDPLPEGVEVWSTPGGSWAYLVNAVETAEASIELWKWRLLGDDRYGGVGGTPGTPDSMAHVLRGELVVRRGEVELLRVAEGGSARLASAGGYTFGAGGEVVDFLWVPTVPRGSTPPPTSPRA
ncbi:helix-turn-helix domain-containing protein [Actinosynnema pretiosum]|uniref:helix-turn-helix domain-containing protein n=2 Tax=Actinosynnema TaxID=40566 RepID=UPI000AC7A642|nr:helix-turn-helix transcriptional regulator [Actinosynnema pretiosum]